MELVKTDIRKFNLSTDKIRVWKNQLKEVWTLWLRRYQTRKELAELSNWQLKDVGISRVDAWQEGRKSFWKA